MDVEAKKTQIEKYANQQLQTRKNEEYRALAHEIDGCKADINKIEDQEIELMEQAEAAQKEVVRATQEAAAAKKLVDEQVAQLNQREENLKKELAELQSGRAEPRGGGGRNGAGALRTAAEEQGRQRRRGRGPWRLRRLPHEIARASSGHLPGAQGTRLVHQLRPDSVLHPRHGPGRGGVNSAIPRCLQRLGITVKVIICRRHRQFPISEPTP